MAKTEVGYARVLAKESNGAEHIAASAVVNDFTLTTRDGDVMQTIEIAGLPSETADASLLNTKHESLNLLLRNIGSPELTVYSHLVRRREKALPSGAGFSGGFAQQLNDSYTQRLERETLYVNDLFLTLVYRPPYARLAKRLGPLARFSRGQEAYREDLLEAVEHLEELTGTVVGHLEEWGPRRLSAYDFQGNAFHEGVEFYASLMNGYWQRMPIVPRPLNHMILTARPLFGRETIELRGPERSRTAAILTIKEYPTSVAPTSLQGLLGAPYECVLTQSFSFMERAKALFLMKTQQRRMRNSGDAAESQIVELERARDELQSGAFAMGEHNLSLLVYGNDLRELQDVVADARKILADAGCVVAREDLAMQAAFWAQLPGNMAYRPRPAPITSRNFAALSPFYNYPRGQAEGNHWGECVSLLTTAAGSPYYFNFHVRDLGNTVIVGPSGSGKTVLQGFALTQLEKHAPRVVFFDKDRGAELMVRAAGGRYTPLKVGQPSGLNPFRGLNNTPANVQHLVRLVETMAHPGRSFSSAQDVEVHEAVQGVFDLPPQHRRLARLAEYLDKTDPDGVYAHLQKWVGDGRHAWVFDNAEDTVDFSSGRLFGFDVTEFLDDPAVRTPVLFYLFYRAEELVDGSPLVLFVDEFWKVLGDSVFANFVNDKLKTIRKQNGFLVAATQSPADALQSSISHTILEQTATKIFLPNDGARWNDYGDSGFGCSRREFEIIRTLPPRHFLVKQGRLNSVVIRLDLSGLDDELAILSGTKGNVAICEAVRAEVGDDPAAWMPVFHTARRQLANQEAEKATRAEEVFLS